MLIRTGLVVVSIILASLICYNCSAVEDLSYSDIVYVGGSGPGNYSSIQEAINDVAIGGTVFVYNGTYYENIIVNKKIAIIGEDKNSTVIDARGEDFAVKITSDDVIFEKFFVKNATDLYFPDPWELGALSVIKASNVSISNNVFSKNFIGICLLSSHKCVLKRNEMYGCSIVLWGGPREGELGAYIHDIDQSNQVNNKTVCYYLDRKDIDHDEEVGEVFFINCSNSRVSNVSIDNVSAGIQICFSINITIENCTLMDIQSTALHFDHSNQNIIRNNLLLRNDHFDFVFLDSSSYNIFRHNIIHGGGAGITLMRKSNHNLFYRNSLSGERISSMLIDSSNWNVIRQNNIDGSSLKRTFNRSIGGDVLLSRYSFFNKFDGNYWNEWIGNKYNLLKLCPKVIFGVGSAIVDPHFFPPFIDLDWHPASEPYLI
jgi:parallel beta-helix repeat protein